MKRLILTSSLVLSLSCGLALAQAAPQQQSAPQQAPAAPAYRHHHHAPNPQKQAEFISRKFNLSPDQTARLEPILATRDQQMRALRQNSQTAPQDRHQQMRSIQQQTEQQLSSVLSPEQITQLREMRHHGRWHHGRHGEAQPNQAPSA